MIFRNVPTTPALFRRPDRAKLIPTWAPVAEVIPCTFLRLLFIFFVISLFTTPIALAHSKAYRNFWHPQYLGEQLNYCLKDGNTCGAKVAEQYCRIMGYAGSSYHVKANNLGLTHILKTREYCKGWTCNGFKLIRCVSKLKHIPPRSYHYRLKHFVFPRFNNYRVDWCYDGHKGCGHRAALSFCRRLGFTKAHSFVKQCEVPATQAIGNQKLCFGPKCSAFKVINCYR